MLGPFGDAAGDIDGERKSLFAQETNDIGAATAMMAHHENLPIARERWHVLRNLVHRNQRGAGNPADIGFPRFADVDEQRVLIGRLKKAMGLGDRDLEGRVRMG